MDVIVDCYILVSFHPWMTLAFKAPTTTKLFTFFVRALRFKCLFDKQFRHSLISFPIGAVWRGSTWLAFIVHQKIMKAYIQLLSKFSLDSDFCHNYLHTLCTKDLFLQCIERWKSLFILCFIKHMHNNVTTKHFILKLNSFPAKIWHVILHLVTPPLVVITAWILLA